MATLEETLKKLNKDKKEQDKVSLLGDKEVIRTRTSTGSPYIDYLSGGHMNGGYNCLVAKGGSGKSSMSLLSCLDVISKGKIAVYFDGEGTLDDSYFKRMGINKHNFIHRKGRNLEKMLDEAEAFSQTDGVGIIVFDSIPILITLYHFDMGEFCVKINLYENYREDEKMFESDGHIEEIYDSCDANLIFDTRIEAENHAFVTAFTFLEARINVFSQINTPSVK